MSSHVALQTYFLSELNFGFRQTDWGRCGESRPLGPPMGSGTAPPSIFFGGVTVTEGREGLPGLVGGEAHAGDHLLSVLAQRLVPELEDILDLASAHQYQFAK